MIARLRARQEWIFFAALPHAGRGLAAAWWGLVGLRALLPAGFAIAMGALVGAVQRGGALAGPLAAVGTTFVLLQVLQPVHKAVSASLGSRLALWLHDELARACVEPPGIAHLEDPVLAEDLQLAHDFDLGMTGPPLFLSMDFIAGGLVDLFSGIAAASVLVAFGWWAPVVLVLGWGSTHWLLRESAIWKDRNTDEVRFAQRNADYAYRMAVEPPAAKELRLFGLAGWVLDRFVEHRKTLHRLQYEATRLRERSIVGCVVIISAANAVVALALAAALHRGDLDLGSVVTFAQALVGASAIAFGGLNWSIDGVAPATAAVLRLRKAMAPVGALPEGSASAAAMPAREIRFRQLSFAYPRATAPVLEGLDLVIPAGSSLAIVGQNGAGKTTLAKLLCRLYDPTAGAIEVDGVDLRTLDVASWRSRVAAVFQDYVRFERSLRDNVAPAGAPDEVILAALADAGAAHLADLDTILAKGYDGGTDLSGGQWQRVALARALCAVRMGAGVVLLDEPTAQLDVRGEAEIFERLLAATRHCTTILVSHRFSTVRLADRICVVEHGAVVELGTHDELLALDGRYRTMFDLQAQRFNAAEVAEGEEVLDALG
jgi:ABC-type transport system involved in cytochrome bd biosynthesis fused ATPase/permease subunit